MKSVAIIGGGITGLTAAFQLRQRHIPVALFEAANRVGGVIETVRSGGFLAESGPNTLLETSPVIGTLIRDLGLESRRLDPDPRMKARFIVRDGRMLPLPMSPFQFAGTRLFSIKTKLALLREPFVRPAPPDQEEDLAQFVRRRLSQEFLDYAIDPFVAGVYAGEPSRLSVKHALPKLYALEQKYGSLIQGRILGARARKKRAETAKNTAGMLSFDEGLQVLTDALGEGLRESLHLHSPVYRIQGGANGWKIHPVTDRKNHAESHAAVLLCLPADKLAGLEIETPKLIDLSLLSEIRYPPVTSVVLGFHRDAVRHPLDGFGMLVPKREPFKILGTIFSSSLFENRAPQGCVTLTTYVGGTRAPDRAQLAPDAIERLVLEDLKKLLDIRAAPVFHHQRAYPRAIPQYEVGYGRFKDAMARAERQASGLFIAGHIRDGISLSDSILAGFNVAQRIEEFLASFKSPGPEVTV